MGRFRTMGELSCASQTQWAPSQHSRFGVITVTPPKDSAALDRYSSFFGYFVRQASGAENDVQQRQSSGKVAPAAKSSRREITFAVAGINRSKFGQFGQFGNIAFKLVRTFSHSLVIGRDSQHYLARVSIQIRLRDCPTFLRTRSVVFPVNVAVTHGRSFLSCVREFF